MALAVEHPNVAKVYEIGQDEDSHYIALEYLPNDLKGLVEDEGQLTVERVLELGGQIASGLAAAHEQGIVHRDIKPENILIDDEGNAKVTDFGIARAIFLSTMTRTGAFMGSPAYMSPEQWEGKADERSDIYSLGILLYQLIVGSIPFESQESPMHLGAMHREEPFPIENIRELDIPDYLFLVIEGCVAKDPDERFQTAEAVAEALRGGIIDLPDQLPAPEPTVIVEPTVEPEPIPEDEPSVSLDPIAPPQPTGLTVQGALRTSNEFARRNPIALTSGLIAVALITLIFLVTQGGSTTADSAPVQFELPSTSSETVIALEFEPDSRDAQGISRIFVEVPEGDGIRTLETTIVEEPPVALTSETVVDKYLEIDLQGAGSTDSVRATIEFDVTLGWLAEHDLNVSMIRLFRYHDGWDQLPTEYLGSIGETELFRAATPGFSYFAIGGLTAIPTPTVEPTETATVDSPGANQTTVPASPTLNPATATPAPDFFGEDDVDATPVRPSTPTVVPTEQATTIVVPTDTSVPFTATPTPLPLVVIPSPLPRPTSSPVPTSLPEPSPTPIPTTAATNTPTVQPGPPSASFMVFSGSVTMGGQPVNDGLEIVAKIGDKFESSPVKTSGGGYSGLVVGPASESEGESIQFILEGGLIAEQVAKFSVGILPITSQQNLTFKPQTVLTPTPVSQSTPSPEPVEIQIVEGVVPVAQSGEYFELKNFRIANITKLGDDLFAFVKWGDSTEWTDITIVKESGIIVAGHIYRSGGTFFGELKIENGKGDIVIQSFTIFVNGAVVATPLPSATPIPTIGPSPTATSVPTPTPTVVPGATVTPTPTVVPIPTIGPSPTATSVPTPTPTVVPGATVTPTPTVVPTPVPTPTPEPTATATPVPPPPIHY